MVDVQFGFIWPGASGKPPFEISSTSGKAEIVTNAAEYIYFRVPANQVTQVGNPADGEQSTAVGFFTCYKVFGTKVVSINRFAFKENKGIISFWVGISGTGLSIITEK